jgi:hypothetical protein
MPIKGKATVAVGERAHAGVTGQDRAAVVYWRPALI